MQSIYMSRNKDYEGYKFIRSRIVKEIEWK